MNEIHMKNPSIGVNGKSNKGIHVKSWNLFMDCIELHKLTVSLLMQLKSSVTTCSR